LVATIQCPFLFDNSDVWLLQQTLRIGGHHNDSGLATVMLVGDTHHPPLFPAPLNILLRSTLLDDPSLLLHVPSLLDLRS